MNKLNLQVLLSAVDKITAPFKSAEKATKQLSSALKQSYEERKKLEKQQALIESFKQAEKSLSKTSNEFELAKNKARELKKELKTTEIPTKNLTKTFEKQKKEVDELKLKHHKQVAKLKELKQKLTEAGIDSKRLGEADSQLKNRVDQVTKSIDKQKKALSDLNKQQINYQKYQQRVQTLKANSEKLQNFGQRNLIIGGTGVGGGYKLFKPAAEFEQSFSKVIALTRLDKNNAEQAKKIEALKKQAIDLGEKNKKFRSKLIL
ncbi:hypothetical protein CEP49_03165 [Mergibacter septicus]|uniref:hypothetical protein n=1 Tax=Mergibacter septicus TaxID=221402 RepID=UPI0011794816|nr:hypothetical protein [Mergibacter septicus]AWX13623.1 hypothetical protein CEP49_03165 [Mergibacter septicus]